jgi:hypothetical protein
MALRPFHCRPIPACGWHCPPPGGSPAASMLPGRTRFISQPKDRSASSCAPIAAGAGDHSRRATLRVFPNTSRRVPLFRSAGRTRRCGAFIPLRQSPWWRHHRFSASLPSSVFPISRCGRAAWTPIFSGRIARSHSIFHDQFSQLPDAWRWKRTSKRSFRSTSPARRSSSAGGPQEEELRYRFPDVKFLGVLVQENLAAHLAAADAFVFPSRTDTFGLVQLEALSCGVPIAAFPVTGPQDVVGNNPVGVLSEDLRAACLGALGLSRQACRAFALNFSWEKSARQFVGHVQKVALGLPRQPILDLASPAIARGWSMRTQHERG